MNILEVDEIISSEIYKIALNIINSESKISKSKTKVINFNFKIFKGIKSRNI